MLLNFVGYVEYYVFYEKNNNLYIICNFAPEKIHFHEIMSVN